MSCTCTKSELMWCCLNIKRCVRIYFGILVVFQIKLYIVAKQE